VFLGDGAGGPGDPLPADTRLYVYDDTAVLAEYVELVVPERAGRRVTALRSAEGGAGCSAE
jgi:hypothetical protein